MNARQKRFADNYIKTGNITQSAVDAGYSKTYANSQGYKLLENVGIKTYIDKVNKEIESAKIADMKEIKEFWTTMLREEEQEPNYRLRASEYLAKTNGAFIDKVEHSGELGVINKEELIDKYLSDENGD